MHIKKNGRIKLPISNKYFKSYKKIAVIGAGWFGCHIAFQLIKKNYLVKIYEKENDIFCEASGNNQNRLHLGFHYPRSLITRTQSIFGFNNFIKEYPNLSKKIKNNIYAIASDANNITDFGTYVQIMKSTNLKFKLLNPKKYKLFNVEGALSCKERMINSEKAKIFFKNKLYRNLVLNSEIKKIAKKKNM